MEYSPLLNLTFIIPTGIVVLLDFASFSLYNKWNRSGQFRKSKTLLLLKPFGLAICVYFLFTQFGAGAFLGSMYCMAAPIIGLIILFSFIAQIRREYTLSAFVSKASLVNLLPSALLIFSIFLPSFLYRPIKNWCSDANSPRILPIQIAAKRYYEDNGYYPRTISALVPDYLPTIPSPACTLLSGMPRKFELNDCEPPYVFTRTVDLMGHDLYSLDDGSRTQAYSFLDGGPYFCP